MELVNEFLRTGDAARAYCHDLVRDICIASSGVDEEVLLVNYVMSIARTAEKRVDIPPVAIIPQRSVKGAITMSV